MIQGKLYRVTLTGADDATSIDGMLAISNRLPFVEWGILVGTRAKGPGSRFPTRHWIERLQIARRVCLSHGGRMNLSLHLCGDPLKAMLRGVNSLPVGGAEGFGRLQLNTHGEVFRCRYGYLCEALASTGIPEIIFQIDGGGGRDLIAGVDDGRQSFSCVPLFDLSHGGGVLPDEWPAPLAPDIPHGYAGGLGPETVVEQVGKIREAARGVDYWIDMETRVRDESGAFSLRMAEDVLLKMAPFVAYRGGRG